MSIKMDPNLSWWGPITPWWAPTTHVVTMPTCVYKYSPPGNVNNVTQDTYQFCNTRGSNVMTTLTTLQLDKSPEESLTKTKPLVGKSGLWNFQSTCQYYTIWIALKSFVTDVSNCTLHSKCVLTQPQNNRI